MSIEDQVSEAKAMSQRCTATQTSSFYAGVTGTNTQTTELPKAKLGSCDVTPRVWRCGLNSQASTGIRAPPHTQGEQYCNSP